ncbi:hypothetical protein KY290_036723 [Solanum tuberosum]|uniref:DUF4283 domain-containing protein n=1 Tax=Solanum tuberosum TaxID=4113 RepID=A0ABQ7TVK2_SOLTU|nr:hypothetical protein KY290_036723 [Solanum tuberosum]
MESHENGLLKRCLVGHLEGGNKERRTLSEVRRWSSLLWKKAFGVNIYEMYGGKFLFEFPNRNMAEQTLQGQWNWKNQRFNLEWWFPLVGCTPNNILTKETWVRIIGIPLHLWSSQVFQEIGNLCGGWLATEEETELKNHMMWARILVENDGRNIPKEVSVSRYGVVYHFPIWAESHVRVEMLPEIGKGVPGEENKRSTIPSFTQRFIGCKVCKKGTQSLISRDFLTGEHVGGSWLTADNEERREACERHMPHLNEGEILGVHQQPNTRKRVSRKLGPDYSSQVIFNDILGKDPEDESSNISLDFVESRHCRETENTHMQLENQIIHEEKEMANMVGETIIESLHHLIEIEENDTNMIDTEVEDIRTSKTGDQRSITEVGEWEIEEAEPLQTRQQEVVRNKERETSVWVQQNLIKLGKVLGADFQGHEEEALELLLQVDSARQARRMKPETVCKKTRLRGSQELKSLVNFDVKFKNSGNRSKGRNLTICNK